MKRKASRKAKPPPRRAKARTVIGPTARKPTTRKSKTRKPTKADAVDTLAAAGAAALRLTVDPAWRDGVAFNLRLILQHAARVDEFALPDDAEPAPIFRA